MLELVFHVVEDIQKRHNFTDTNRGFRRILKQANKNTVLLWHRRFVQRHFQRSAYHWYPGYHNLFKMKPPYAETSGRPLVKSGQLLSQIDQTPTRVKATYAMAKIEMPTGRPPKKNLQKEIRIKARILRAQHPGLRWADYKRAAESEVYRKWGYGAALQKKFQAAITEMNPAESKTMAREYETEIVTQLNQSGPMRKRTIRGTG